MFLSQAAHFASFAHHMRSGNQTVAKILQKFSVVKTSARELILRSALRILHFYFFVAVENGITINRLRIHVIERVFQIHFFQLLHAIGLQQFAHYALLLAPFFFDNGNTYAVFRQINSERGSCHSGSGNANLRVAPKRL